MWNAKEKDFFEEHGYLHARSVLTGAPLEQVRAEFDKLWESEGHPVSQDKLLKHRAFIELIEYAPILERQRAVFGNQIQLLQFDLLRQGPQSTSPERQWHRDFSFPGERPLAINTIL